MLLLDPTELNRTTRLPQDAFAIARECKNLEAETGADMLISPLEDGIPTDAAKPQGRLLLRKHLAAHALLIQRKTSDVLNLITDHHQILAKMQQWTTMPVLLTLGQYGCDNDGKLLWNGKRLGGDKGWSYWSYQGTLLAWQWANGCVINLSRDSLFVPWYEHAVKQLAQYQETVVITPRKPSQQIIMTGNDDDAAGYERNACIAALCTIAGISVGKAIKLTDYCGNLAHALAFLSDPDHLTLKKDNPAWPEGIANAAFANAIKWLGLQSGGEGAEQWREVMEIMQKTVGKE